MPNPAGPPPSLVTRTLAIPAAQRTASQNHLLHMWNTGQWDAYSQEIASARPGTTTGGGTAPGGTTDGKPTPAQTQADVDKLNAQRDAGTILTNLFTQYGLGTLAPQIVNYIQQGYSSDAITILLQQTAEYKQRFAANDMRIKAGLPALSPGEYIATERAYRQVMSSAGLPVGFYDSPSDFTQFLANDMSATELQSRVSIATQAVNQAPQSTRDYFSQWYGAGDLIAYALDPTRAETLIEQRIKAAEAAGVGRTQGVNLTRGQGESIGANSNLTLDQIQQGMGFIGTEQPITQKLDQIYGGNVTQDDLVNEVFNNDAQANKKRQQLASQERAAFSGSTGSASSSSLSSERLV